jgi:hypothetical protein
VPWIVERLVERNLLGETWRPASREVHEDEADAYCEMMDLRDNTDGSYRLRQR